MASIRATNKSITRKLNKIENAVKSKLTAFYNKKIKPRVQFPIEALREQYESEVKTLIRKTVQDAYLTGSDVVAEKVTDKRDFTVFISQTDIRNIASLTDKLNEQFWKTTGRLVRREQEFILNNATKELEKKKSFDDEAAMIGLSAFFAYSAFNSAVLSKTQQAIQTPILLSADGFSFDVNFGVERLDELPLSGRVMFLTQEDAKVDEEICMPLNRTVYDINDPDIPVPPEATHLHCRCRLVPIIDEFNELA